MNKNSIVLFQSEIAADNKYIKLLKQEGFNAVVIPTLSFNFVNKEKLQNCLHNVNDYCGIIFTSTRAVTAVDSAITSSDILSIASWREKCNFSVGKATAELVHSLLNLETFGSESGNSENLCQLIIEKHDFYKKPFIFPCSNIRKDTIPSILLKNGIQVEEIICYETVPNDSFQESWESLVSKEGLPEILVFFSPSGVQYCSKIVKDSYAEILQPKFIAIGPSTEKALSEANINYCKTAEKPNPESVLCVIKDFLSS